METTLIKSVKGETMEKIFDGSGTSKLCVKHYKALNVSDADYNNTETYKFEITVRHPEGTDAMELLNSAVRVYK